MRSSAPADAVQDGACRASETVGKWGINSPRRTILKDASTRSLSPLSRMNLRYSDSSRGCLSGRLLTGFGIPAPASPRRQRKQTATPRAMVTIGRTVFILRIYSAGAESFRKGNQNVRNSYIRGGGERTRLGALSIDRPQLTKFTTNSICPGPRSRLNRLAVLVQ